MGTRNHPDADIISKAIEAASLRTGVLEAVENALTSGHEEGGDAKLLLNLAMTHLRGQNFEGNSKVKRTPHIRHLDVDWFDDKMGWWYGLGAARTIRSSLLDAVRLARSKGGWAIHVSWVETASNKTVFTKVWAGDDKKVHIRINTPLAQQEHDHS